MIINFIITLFAALCVGLKRLVYFILGLPGMIHDIGYDGPDRRLQQMAFAGIDRRIE